MKLVEILPTKMKSMNKIQKINLMMIVFKLKMLKILVQRKLNQNQQGKRSHSNV